MTQSTMTGETTIGIDLGDRRSHICVLSSEGEVLERAEVPTTVKDMTFGARPDPQPIGTNFCMANPNTSGTTGSISTFGFTTVADNDVTLTTSNLPLNSFGFFIVSPDTAFVMNLADSSGNLCLGGAIGRYVGPGEVQTTGMTGGFSLNIDLTQIPTPTGPAAVVAGETRAFRAWHRDVLPGGGSNSNFTDGLEIRAN